MKTRIIVGVVGVPLILLIIFLGPVWLLGTFVGVVAALAAWELMSAACPNASTRPKLYALLSGFAIPFASAFFEPIHVSTAALFLLMALEFGELMLSFAREGEKSYDAAVMAMFAGGVMPVLISAIVRLGLRDNGSVYAFLPFAVTFSADSLAYFAGVFLGKHKACPHLSPHKTVEGCAGGILGAVVIVLIYGAILKAVGFYVNFLVLGIYAFLGSVACELGDLCFSAIKRVSGVKDYGNLIPGHGGMLDRFDSMFWTAALIEILVNWVPAIM